MFVDDTNLLLSGIAFLKKPVNVTKYLTGLKQINYR